MTRVTRGAVLLLACAVAFASLPAGSAHAQTFDPQAYLVYDMESVALPLPSPLVSLEDQFGLREGAEVLERWFFMNPVDKYPVNPPGDPELITNPFLHYR